MSSPPRILVCDHRGEGLIEALRPLTSIGLRLELSTSPAQTRSLLRELRPDLVVIDPLARGGVSELGALTGPQGGPVPAPTGGSPFGGQPIPVLVVADPSDPLQAVLAARALGDGPWDVVYRGAPLEEVLMRIERLRGQAEGLTELDEMRFAAVHDDRTHLLRPIPFQQRMREHFSAAGRHHFDLALVLLDLDRFGLVNKEFDHMVGDAVIGQVGTVVRENLRAEDVGGRIGGDEFAIVLPYTRRVDAARVVNRLRDQLQELTGPIGDTGREVHISASLGFETYDGTDLESVETLRRHAEVALRRAKELGGNRALYFRNLDQEEGGGGPRLAEAAGS
jgi:diguanylate cyclase (GGDEF)-like protein